MRAIDPIGETAPEPGQVAVLGCAGESGLDVPAGDRRVAGDGGEDRVEEAVRLPDEPASELLRGPRPRRDRVRPVVDRVPDGVPCHHVADGRMAAARRRAHDAAPAASTPSASPSASRAAASASSGSGRDRGGERDPRRHRVAAQHGPAPRLRLERAEVVAARLELAPCLGAVGVEMRGHRPGPGDERDPRTRSRPAGRDRRIHVRRLALGHSEPQRPLAERRLEPGLQQEPEPQPPLGGFQDLDVAGGRAVAGRGEAHAHPRSRVRQLDLGVRAVERVRPEPARRGVVAEVGEAPLARRERRHADAEPGGRVDELRRIPRVPGVPRAGRIEVAPPHARPLRLRRWRPRGPTAPRPPWSPRPAAGTRPSRRRPARAPRG